MAAHFPHATALPALSGPCTFYVLPPVGCYAKYPLGVCWFKTVCCTERRDYIEFVRTVTCAQIMELTNMPILGKVKGQGLSRMHSDARVAWCRPQA